MHARLSLAWHILHLPPQLELGVLNGWIHHMSTVSVTALILRHSSICINLCYAVWFAVWLFIFVSSTVFEHD